MIAPGFEKVSSCFDDLLNNQRLHPAAQLVVYHRGMVVVDLADNQLGTPKISADTPLLILSVSKCLTAAAVLRLIGDNLVELDAPIAAYWPEFAQGGKASATIRHALLHQAGIPAPHMETQVFLWPFWPLLTNTLAREKAQYKPGTQTAYHVVNFGFILGEVVRRVTGQSIDQYLQTNFFTPMELMNIRMKSTTHDLIESPKVVSLAPDLRYTTLVLNLPVIQKTLLPAVSVRSSARDLAAFFSMLLNDGEYKGKSYINPETIRLATRSHFDGYDGQLERFMNWGLGFIIGGGKHQPSDPHAMIMGYGSSETTFGGIGLGTCIAWADRNADVVMAFTCNGMLGDPGVKKRWAAISNAVWDGVNNVSN
jgi:CubicO group peptidase (beta-lactamase class C family)